MFTKKVDSRKENAKENSNTKKKKDGRDEEQLKKLHREIAVVKGKILKEYKNQRYQNKTHYFLILFS